MASGISLHSYIFDSFHTDFSKAFDHVDHNHLMSTLDSIGIGEPLLSWLCSYITNRIQWVTVDSTSSEHFMPSSGVPQGAVLSPLLFTLFVNSTPSVLQHTKLLIFADDMKIFLRIKSISDCHLLQNDLQRLVSWGESLGLDLNIPKCSVITFCRTNVAFLGPWSYGDLRK
ncbi:putative RNA-directed DNA polymerase [Aphis craccivora]|uniref:Putative RNA-directed DNA polymerase n=1 Tax=Aphis craccivora TaxID=307492 RepID=A0A6G0YLP2_APHCR|nr:putative RNA-directed DNA polymerase [Aphis craccivora]